MASHGITYKRRASAMCAFFVASVLSAPLAAIAETPAACVSGPVDLESGKPASAADYTARTVVDWARLQMSIARQMPGFQPPVVSRAMGYVGIGLYEALLPAMPGYRSVAAQLEDPPFIPPVYPDASYHWPTVAAAYMKAATEYFYTPFGVSDRNEEELAAVQELWGNQAPALQKDTLKKIYKRSVRRGRDVAAAMYAWSMSDKAPEPYAHNFPGDYHAPEGEDKWEAPSQKLYTALQPYWGKKRKFALKDGECDPPAPPPFSTAPDSRFMKEVHEIYDMGVSRTQEQREIALFWADEAGRTATPPGHILQILADVLEAKKANLALAAESMAKVGVAVADAFVECWRIKFSYNYPRPDKMIRRYIDPNWTGVYITPPFPEYPSGHSVQSGAAFAVMASVFGDAIEYTDHTRDDLFYPARSYTSFTQMGKEAAASRMYGGVHFRSAVENGLKQGECIASKTLSLKFKETPEPFDLLKKKPAASASVPASSSLAEPGPDMKKSEPEAP